MVDDEVPLAEVVASYLKREMFDVSLAHNGADALALAREIDPDVVILDLALPGIDGVEVCRQLRTFSDAYVVMLTARDTEVDTIVGLSVGADDYVTKPFSPRELVARIRAMLRRPRTVATPVGATGNSATAGPPPRVFGPLSIDVASRQVFIDDEPVLLTRTEFDVLAALSSRPARGVQPPPTPRGGVGRLLGGQRAPRRRARRSSAPQTRRRPSRSALCDHRARCRIPDGKRLVTTTTKH